MKTIRNAILYLVLICSISCTFGPSESALNERPHDPWIFRSVLDNNARIVTLALDLNLWAAYSTENAALYQAWKGAVNFDGPVYTTQHGPQPLSVGDKYVVNRFIQPWKIKTPGGDLNPTVQYKGHKVVNDQAVLMYELEHPNLSSSIIIEERVDAHTNEKNQPVFQRRFTTSSVPENHSVVLATNVFSIIVKANIATDGELTFTKEADVKAGKITALDLEGELTLNSNSTTNYDVTFMENPLIYNGNLVEEEEDQDPSLPEGLRLIAKSDCKTCHNKTLQTIGPSYMAIAERYPMSEDNVNLLASKIKEGGSGVWGNQVMTPHPIESKTKIRKMAEYILSLGDSGEQVAVDNSVTKFDPANVEGIELLPGLMTKVYEQRPPFSTFSDVRLTGKYIYAGILPTMGNLSGNDFKGLEDNFAIRAKGYLHAEKAGNYALRIWSDDGSRIFIEDNMVIDNDGMHGAEYKEVNLSLEEGYYPITVDFFQGAGGKFLSLNWKVPGAGEFATVPIGNLYHNAGERADLAGYSLPMTSNVSIPGNANPLDGVHPSFDLHQARALTFTPKVGGMDFFSDGRMVVSTWDAAGSVYVVENVNSDNEDDIVATKIAHGLAEPLGLKVVDDTIYIMQKQEMTKLIDNDGDGIIDEYRTLCDDWIVSANFHEFGFGLAYKEGYFYATLATAINPGGASTQPQMADRGKVLKVSRKDGSREFIASGLRTPNGIGWGYNDELYVADNQGDWLPASKIIHVTEGAWFGSRSVDPEGSKNFTEKKPVVWLPQDEIGNSPSTPSYINVGPYKGQMIHGEVTNGGVKRVFVEEVNGEYQGALFRFTQGLEAGINRMVWGPGDKDLYVGGIGSTGNWGHTGTLWYGLQRLSYNEKSTFEMLAVRAKTNGVEVEFTEPLKEGDGWIPSEYEISQWYYLPTIEYGGPKLDNRRLAVRSASVSEDRKKVFLEIPGIKSNHVLYLRIANPFSSESENTLWSTEMWYTMNSIPQNNPGVKSTPPQIVGNNALSEIEKAQGWKLLFDGKTTNGWRKYNTQSIGSSWKVRNGELYLDSQKKDDGHWQAKDGGDIITDQAYENYDFQLEWKISTCGNSGIIFNVVESEEYEFVWQTGPEMQILDNICHPDTKYPTHRAGDLYDMIETEYVTVNPAGEWNKVRILSENGKVQFWLNGYRVVEFEMHTEEWKQMIANSKFKDMASFGSARKGHFALQDHGDPVYFRNIKIKEL